MAADTIYQLSGSRTEDISETISIRTGLNLRRVRTRQGYSLDRLAKAAGVSRAMLSQIETGKSSPTLSVLSKIAVALAVPCSSLIVERDEPTATLLTLTDSKRLISSDGKFQSRALFPYDGTRTVEFYEIRIAAHHSEKSDAHRHGTIENIVVASGTVEIVVGRQPPYLLGEGDALTFEADVPHIYRNMTGSEALLFLVCSYREPIGA